MDITRRVVLSRDRKNHPQGRDGRGDSRGRLAGRRDCADACRAARIVAYPWTRLIIWTYSINALREGTFSLR